MSGRQCEHKEWLTKATWYYGQLSREKPLLPVSYCKGKLIIGHLSMFFAPSREGQFEPNYPYTSKLGMIG